MVQQLNLFEFDKPNFHENKPSSAFLQKKIKKPNRKEVKFTIECLDDSIPLDHKARTVWNFIEMLDFSSFYKRYHSLENCSGRAFVDPKILTALWVYGISDGIISSRKIATYCEENKAYAWLCGGVSVGHHLLSGFRADFSDLFEEFVVQSITMLYDKNLITMKAVAQDGTKLQASASSSMSRKKTLTAKALEMKRYIINLEEELKNGEFEKEQKKQKERELFQANRKKDRLVLAAKELQKHKDALNENRIKNRNRRLSNKDVSNLRASATDPECRKMRMADHSYKAAYNVQIATDVDTELVLKTSISQNSHDGGELYPMHSSLKSTYGIEIESYLADSAYRNKEDFQKMFDADCEIFLPSKKKKTLALRKRVLSGDCDADTEADKAWIKRMEEEESNTLYSRRIRVSETINAFFANHGIKQLLVRGVNKVKGFINLACLSYNMLIIKRLYQII